MRTSLLALIVAATPALADVRLPAVISSGMVIQQSSKVPLWGWATPGEEVRVTVPWLAAPAVTSAGKDGRWTVTLDTPGAKDSPAAFTITIEGKNTLALNDVLLGEVWLASGQSNMEWPLSASDGAAAAVAGANHPRVRLFNVRNEVAARPKRDCTSEAGWVPCTPESVAGFSAVSYYFARDLHAALGVPVGVIEADWGGTPVQAWTSAAGLAPFPEFTDALAYMDALDPDPNVRAAKAAAFAGRWWDNLDTHRDGAGKGWMAPGFDDASWKVMTLPATLGPDGLDRFDGVVYYRRSVTLTGTPGAGTVELGPIDDRDDVWINGTRVGGMRDDGQWSKPRTYEVPAGVLKEGVNIIAVRMVDTSGPGGINGKPEQMVLRGGGQTVALAGEWKHRRGAAMSALPAIGQAMNVGPGSPSALYNAMIHPVVPFGIRGAIWYQGESNRGQNYAAYFPAMIRQWREDWGRGDFPFLFVQISPFSYGNDRGETALLREAQTSTWRTVPNTGMVVTMDIGNPADIHPRNKKDVGERLARFAKAGTYGVQDVVASGPVYAGMRLRDSDLFVTFDLRGAKELKAGGDLSGWAVAGADMKFCEAVATITGPDTVRVTCPRVAEPVAVRYGWCNACEPNLASDAGLPAVPFRSDAWDTPKGGWPTPEDGGKTGHLTNEAGFVPMFDGRTLDGWVNVNTAPSTFRAESGMIRCSGEPTGVIRTAKQYQNFVLEMEWRHLSEQGNAGLFVWSDGLCAKGVPFTRSVEVQVMVGSEADWYTSDGDVFPIHGATMTPLNPRPKGGQRSYPTEKRMKPSPQWNHYRVTCVDGEVSLAVNGKVVTQGKDVSLRKGYICLESEGTPIDFRNIIIKELPGKALPPEQVASAEEGFVPLFTGVDFAGWKFEKAHEGHFIAGGNVIRLDGQGPELWTEKAYKDFVLVADWRWTRTPTPSQRPVILPSGEEKKGTDGKSVMEEIQDAGDSGIYLRGSSKSQVNAWCWGIGSGEVYGYRTDASMPPEVRAGVTPRMVADAPIGQWNRFVITMRGERLTVVLNGKTVIENAQLPGVAAEGPIALQQHGDPIEFTNLFIKELR